MAKFNFKLVGVAFVGYLLSCNTAFAANTISLKPSAAPPDGTSDAVDPSFAGFGIEPSNLFSFTGTSKPNTLTFNLLDNLANYTGKPPHMRIGGNTQDYMIFQESQNKWAWVKNPDQAGEGQFKSNSMLIGPRFFEAANRFPLGTTVTWGLNLAYDQSDYIDQITTVAKQVIDRCPNLRLTSFEIGNEPDLYLQNGFRTGEWGGSVYTQQWLNRVSAVYEQVLKPNNLPSNFFEAAATASTIGTNFEIKDLTGFKLDIQANGSSDSYLSSWNQHDYYYYLGVSTYSLTLEHLMQLSTTEEQFAAWEQQIAQSRKTPYPYALREMGVVGPIGLAGITDVFGAALWTLNFLMYGASLGISSVGLHMTDNSNASAWQPVEMYGRQPFVRPLYYGIAAFDQAIGASCTAQVAQENLTQSPAGYDGFIRAYSVYQNKQLASVVVVNGKMANTSQTDKASITVQVQLPTSVAGQTLHLSYLTNEGADATKGTTWNGISFEQSGDGKPTQVSDEDKTVTINDDGSATFSVRDSEAVVANLGKRIGTGQEDANLTACAAVTNKVGIGATSTSSAATRKLGTEG
ncbi:glycoside hydrolase family 79 protein [Xylariaceae sp. FL0662B]|nr:glycoside hydrolase family 79 protein [Xylariaceae sp. FL0662B]